MKSGPPIGRDELDDRKEALCSPVDACRVVAELIELVDEAFDQNSRSIAPWAVGGTVFCLLFGGLSAWLRRF